MASATAMQSILGSSVAYGAAGKTKRVNPAKYSCASTLHSYAPMRVRSMAMDGDQKQQPSTVTNAFKNSEPPPSSPPPKPKNNSTKFSEVLAFSGPAPERINGRLAMVGFVAALAVELSNGQDLFAQISNGGVSLFLGTSILLSVASLIPLLKGVSVESKSDGIMTSDAELLNGRLAMLGLVALAFTEYVKGGTLV